MTEASRRKWRPVLFGADEFDENLINNIKNFQSKAGFKGDKIDGVAGKTTVAIMYKNLNKKYRFDETQMDKFKQYISKDRSVADAASEVLKDADVSGEDNIKNIQSALLQNPEAEDNKEMPFKHFKGTKNVSVGDTRLSWVHPDLLPWLKGISEKWEVDDISLPFGGGSYPTATTKSGRTRDYEGTNLSHDKVWFFHGSHKLGTDIDFRIPLANGTRNMWDQNVNPEQVEIDKEKILRLVDYALKKDSSLRIYFDRSLIDELKKDADRKTLEKIEKVFLHEDGHADHMHFRFRGIEPPKSLKNYTWFLLDQNRKLAKKYNWQPKAFGAGAFDKDLIEKIFKFQEVNKLTPDGVAGPDTIEKLPKLPVAPKLPVGENKILEFLFKFTDEVENELV